MWKPDDQFWRIHRDWHHSLEAKRMKRRLWKRQNGCCARCGKMMADPVLNLTNYDDMKNGRPVKDSDANLLHRECHPKGTYSWKKLEDDRIVDRWVAVLWWLVCLPFRMARWAWRTWRGRPAAPKRHAG